MGAWLEVAMVAAVAFLVSAWANPINQATADRYSEACAAAERNGRLDLAEEACRRALFNVG
jgi:hypothetical protein